MLFDIDKDKRPYEIERVRTKLINTGMKLGLNHPITIKISQDLDKLLSEYSANKGSKSFYN
ncbi:Spo0E family sporulation regulatory protein-aspartic acid phosphatase [Lysinibacillus telephonicus]|uniref:Spo0E family sporulation regulatory protein-aspartic acid phosphatase n=1 Tax=Lysinibacillus telephonicus TaxID=1714840 RepID=UPI003BA1CBE3